MECQNGVSRRPEANITNLVGILSNWDALCAIVSFSDELSKVRYMPDGGF